MSQEPTPDPQPGQEPTPPAGEPPKGDPQPQDEPKGQEPKVFDEAYVKQLRKEAAEARTAKNKLEQQVQGYADRDKTDQEKLEGRATKAESQVADLETKLARFEVAAEKKLPTELAEFLTGSKEEMAAKADVLLERLKTENTPQVPGFDGGARDTPPPEKAPEDAHNDFILGITGHLAQNQ